MQKIIKIHNSIVNMHSIVVDIFSEWSGPCAAMTPNLKKVKLEVGGDSLQLAIAKCDGISYLERFRYSSEPTWMFITEGKMVNLMFGADAPRLTRLIIDELKKEAAVKDGTAIRQAIEISELSAAESVRYEIAKKIEDELIRLKIEKEAQMLKDRRVAVANVVLDTVGVLGVILVFPHAIEQVAATLAELWEPANLATAGIEKPTFTEEMIEELLYFSGVTFPDIDVDSLLSGRCTAYLVKPYDIDLFTETMETTLAEFIYGPSKCPPGSPESPAQILMAHVPVPKEEPLESSTALRAGEPSLGGIPSMPSMSAFQMAPSTTKSKIIQSKTEMSKTAVDSKGELLSKTELGSQAELTSKTEISKTKMSKAKVRSKSQIFSKTSFKEPEEETIPVTGLWTPTNPFTTGTAIKLMFPKIYDPIALPEPVPTPPHIAIAFEAYRRREIFQFMEDYAEQIMRIGFFTSDDPETATLIAKTRLKFDKVKGEESDKDKLVIQLSKKRSEAWCFFSQQSPTFMSHTPEDGEQHCKLFFPEGYDEPDEVEEEVVDTKKKKKGKKGAAKDDKATKTEEVVEKAADTQGAEEQQQEGEEEGEGEGEDEENQGEEEGEAEDDMLALFGAPPPPEE